MTSTPDQFPASTEAAGTPETDPVEKASAGKSEQEHVTDGDAGTTPVSATDERAEPAADGDGANSDEIGPDEAVTSAGDTANEQAAEEAAPEPEPTDDGIETADETVGETAVEATEPEASPEAAAQTERAATGGGPGGRSEAPTEEISVVPPASPEEATPPTATPPSKTAPAEATPPSATAPASAAPADAAHAGDAPAGDAPADGPGSADTPAPTEMQAPTAQAADTPAPGTTEPAPPEEREKPEERERPEEPAPATASDAENARSTTSVAPITDADLDFKALSFAAIAEAHKKALGPRTVVGEVSTDRGREPGAGTEDTSAATPADPPADGAETEQTDVEQTDVEQTESEQTESEQAAVEHTDAEHTAPSQAVDDAEATGTPDLFAAPTTHTPPTAAPPSPFPTPAAPVQHHPGAPAQPTAPQQPPSPFPAAPGNAAHGFPAVHDYAPEATYAGWRPATPADESAKRRRYALVGGAVVAVIAVVAVVAVVVNMVARQQWEPIEAMIAEPREVHPLQLVLGSCVETVPDDGEVSEVLAVPCDEPHTAQVVGRTDFADAAVWPGRDEVDKRVAQVCGTKQLGPVARNSPVVNTVRYVVWGPSEASWDDGDRVGLCLAATADPITQDLLQ
ncbi:septum formation family protein [Promicromonospora sp. MS192]|uniref:septum formation family protein n=1 Tax=Promicromonospora sp. MS192 TaxID=3412684 RepID=UPI003C2DCE29